MAGAEALLRKWAWRFEALDASKAGFFYIDMPKRKLNTTINTLMTDDEYIRQQYSLLYNGLLGKQ